MRHYDLAGDTIALSLPTLIVVGSGQIYSASSPHIAMYEAHLLVQFLSARPKLIKASVCECAENGRLFPKQW